MVAVNPSLMFEAAKRCAPREACGVVLKDGTVIEITNVAPREGLFLMDTDELIAVYEKYGDIDGVWHSHPKGHPEPSPEDYDAHPGGKMMFIVCGDEVHYYGRPR